MGRDHSQTHPRRQVRHQGSARGSEGNQGTGQTSSAQCDPGTRNEDDSRISSHQCNAGIIRAATKPIPSEFISSSLPADRPQHKSPTWCSVPRHNPGGSTQPWRITGYILVTVLCNSDTVFFLFFIQNSGSHCL